MSRDTIIKTIVMNCPYCNLDHSIEVCERLTQALINNVIVDYEETFYCCMLTQNEENEFVPASVLDKNLLKARDAYNAKKPYRR